MGMRRVSALRVTDYAPVGHSRLTLFLSCYVRVSGPAVTEDRKPLQLAKGAVLQGPHPRQSRCRAPQTDEARLLTTKRPRSGRPPLRAFTSFEHAFCLRLERACATIHVTVSDPRGSPSTLPAMQPSLVEAEQLAALTRGMQQVRSIVRRETFGVVLPIKQLEVLDQIIASHEALVTRLRERAQSAHGGVVNLIDALVLLDALVGQVGAAADWLEIARSCPRLPRFNENGPLLSTQKSEQRRGGVLAFIERYFGEATSLMARLKALAESAPGSDPAAVELLLGGYEVQLNCLRALALTSATGAIKSAIDAPSFVHERLLGRLHTVIRWPRFVELSSGLKSAVLTAIARLADELDHPDIARTALEKAYELRSTDIDSTIQSILNLRAIADTPIATLELVERLADLPSEGSIGTPFSRERLGRLSVLRDTFPHLICSADETTEDGVTIVRTALSAHYQWVYGVAPSDENVIHVVTDWQGNGRVVWESIDGLEVRRFSISPEQVMRIFQVSERRAGSPAALHAANSILNDSLAPAMEEFITHSAEGSISGLGLTGVLPIFATQIHGSAIGTSARIVHLHPLHGTSPPPDLGGRVPDLLVLDLCLDSQFRHVELAFRLAHQRQGSAGRIILFNSREERGAISRAEIKEAISLSRWPMYFGHVFSRAELAASAGLLLGASEFLGIEEIAALDLTQLDGLVLIGCASGRYSPLLGGVSVAHAAALAGAKEVIFSSWPLTASQGSRFAEALLRGYGSGISTAETMAAYFRAEPSLAGLFGLMRP
jgi:hypothetical protein